VCVCVCDGTPTETQAQGSMRHTKLHEFRRQREGRVRGQSRAPPTVNPTIAVLKRAECPLAGTRTRRHPGAFLLMHAVHASLPSTGSASRELRTRQLLPHAGAVIDTLPWVGRPADYKARIHLMKPARTRPCLAASPQPLNASTSIRLAIPLPMLPPNQRPWTHESDSLPLRPTCCPLGGLAASASHPLLALQRLRASPRTPSLPRPPPTRLTQRGPQLGAAHAGIILAVRRVITGPRAHMAMRASGPRMLGMCATGRQSTHACVSHRPRCYAGSQGAWARTMEHLMLNLPVPLGLASHLHLYSPSGDSSPPSLGVALQPCALIRQCRAQHAVLSTRA
jgi:hypothetical protein